MAKQTLGELERQKADRKLSELDQKLRDEGRASVADDQNRVTAEFVAVMIFVGIVSALVTLACEYR